MKTDFLSQFLLLLVGLLLTACFGPDPKLVERSFSRSQTLPGFYEVKVLVENSSSGEGEVRVRASLIDKTSRVSYKKDENLDLKAHEKSAMHLFIRAPEGSYELETEVEYPPR